MAGSLIVTLWTDLIKHILRINPIKTHSYLSQEYTNIGLEINEEAGFKLSWSCILQAAPGRTSFFKEPAIFFSPHTRTCHRRRWSLLSPGWSSLWSSVDLCHRTRYPDLPRIRNRKRHWSRLLSSVLQLAVEQHHRQESAKHSATNTCPNKSAFSSSSSNVQLGALNIDVSS